MIYEKRSAGNHQTPEKSRIDGVSDADHAYFEKLGRQITAEVHARYQGMEGQIGERLSPEPLSNTHLEDLYKLSMSDSNEDVVELVNRKALLTPEQREQFEAYRVDHYMATLKEAEVAKVEQRKQIIENASQLEREEDFLILHSLKLTEPERFKEVFNELPVSAKAKFDAFEAREDARIKTSNPEFSVPKLSVDGETWLKQEVPRKNIVDVGSGGSERTAVQMQGKGANEDQRASVQSVNSSKKPSAVKRLKGWIARRSTRLQNLK